MSVSLSPDPIFKAFANDGTPLAYGQLFTYAAGTTTPQATYIDSTETTPNTNPVILNARGECNLWLDVALDYKFTLTDEQGNQIWTVDQIEAGMTQADVIALLTAQFIGKILYPQTQAEIAAGVTPVNYFWIYGDPRRYGAVLDGVTDDTTAIANWAKVGGSLSFPSLTANITSGITLLSNTTVLASKGATISSSNPNISLFSASNQSKILVNGMSFVQTGSPSNTVVGQIYLAGCSDSRVTNCLFAGMCWSGVKYDGCTRCKVDTCYFTGAIGTLQDRNDICIYNASSFCEVINNWCYGGGANGIMVQDPLSGLVPNHNLVMGNYVGVHTQYGLLCYIGGPGGNINSFNKFIGNYVDGITGAESINTSSGAGIYAVGIANGGLIISGNHINNCCSGTTNRTLAPGGIGVTSLGTGNAGVTITDNTITGMTQGDGILITLCPSGGVIKGNQIVIPSSNNGTGPGGGTLQGSCVRVEICSNVTADGNNTSMLGTAPAILVYANGASQSNISVSNNIVSGNTGDGLNVTQSSGFINSNITVSGNAITNMGSSSYCCQLQSISLGSITGNTFMAGSQPSLQIVSCLNLRLANNSLSTTGTDAMDTSGTCTGSYFDKTNIFNGVLTNAATGLITERLGNAIPSGGTAAVGDRVEQSVPVVGNPKGWRCTVAGSAGTWVSEGNL